MILEIGDTVKITAQGTTRTGVIDSVSNYGSDEQSDFYIELTSTQHGAVYWKQSIDGGTVEKVAA